MVTIDNKSSVSFLLAFPEIFFQAAGGLGHSTRRLIDPALGFFPALRGRGKTEKEKLQVLVQIFCPLPVTTTRDDDGDRNH